MSRELFRIKRLRKEADKAHDEASRAHSKLCEKYRFNQATKEEMNVAREIAWVAFTKSLEISRIYNDIKEKEEKK
jgi:hypothetical protein